MQSLGATFAHLPIDSVIFVLAAIVLVVLSLRSGTRIAATLALSLPLAVFLVNALPGTAYISPIVAQFSSNIDNLVLFGVVFFVLYILVFRMLGQYMLSGAMPMNALIAGVASTIVLIVFWLEVPSLTVIWHFGPQIQSIFGARYRLWWLLLSYIALSFARS